MPITVGCKCGWCTDLELTSETNPTCYPECGGEIMLSGAELSDIPLYGDDDEYNAVLFDED